MTLRTWIAALTLTLGLAGTTAHASTITFDEFGLAPGAFDDQEPLDTEYQGLGVTFSGGWEILDDRSFLVDAVSGSNFAAYNRAFTGPSTLGIAFASDITMFSALLGASETPNTFVVTAFLDGIIAQQSLVSVAARSFGAAMLFGTFDQVTVLGFADVGVVDDIRFTHVASPTPLAVMPLPASALLLLGGLLGLLALRRLRRG